MNITGLTRVCAILADPVQQVKTPQLINEWATKKGVDAVLVPLQVPAMSLSAWVTAARGLQNLDGFVVTVPHKMTVRHLCDEVSPAAAMVGAVNVVRRDPDGRLMGHVLDGEGFVAGLRRSHVELQGKRVMLCGAGGAACAIAFALAESGVGELAIYNRTSSKVHELIERLQPFYPSVQLTVATDSPIGFDVVVNATSLGMSPTDPLPCRADQLVAEQLVAEIIMKPALTPVLAIAEEKGCSLQFGLPMLECQIELMAAFLRLGQR